MKPKECEDCPLYKEPGPLLIEFTSDRIDVLFLGHAPPLHDIVVEKHFTAAPILWSSIKDYGINSYGITDVWKCRFPGRFNNGMILYQYCLKLLQGEIERYQPKILMTFGFFVIRALEENAYIGGKPYNASSCNGKLFRWKEFNNMLVIPMKQPANEESGQYIEVWNEGFNKLREVLNGVPI